MALKITLAGEPIGVQLRRNLTNASNKMRRATREAAEEAAKQIEDRGRADIAGAGNFGTRWTQGLKAEVYTTTKGDARIDVKQAVPYWTVFQFGKTIQGKPLLWIPLSFASAAQGVRARDYPGRLFRVERKSGAAPLLLDWESKEPQYFGKESVTIPKKFHTMEIIRDVSRNLGTLYRVRMQGR